MSAQITEAFVQQFADNFMHVAQQQGSRFESAVTVESGIVGMSKSINRLGQRTASQRLNRHADTPLNDQPHTTRFVDLYDWEDGDMIDDLDKVRMLVDPQSDCVKAMVNALNRAKDSVIISAIGGSARSGASSTVALPSTQKIVVDGTNGLTKAKLIAARGLFRKNECDEEAGEELYLAYGNVQLQNLLSDTTLTNSEINTVLSLQAGNIQGAKLFGFNMIPSERQIRSGNTRYCYAWAKSGVVLGVGRDVQVEVGKDPGKGFNTRVYAKMAIGAVRVEEEKVVEIACYEA